MTPATVEPGHGAPSGYSHEVPPYSSTRLTAHLGLVLAVMLAVMFASGAFFFLYTFNFNAPPWFTAVRFAHFYTGLASIPILLGKYGSTSIRFAGYYLRVPRYRAAGPPAWVPRVLSPLLAADFFVLYFSGLYMLFHYYYTVTNIPPFGAKPVQVHLWAAIIGAPLVTIHLLWHLASALRTVGAARPAAPAVAGYAEGDRARIGRRALLAGLGGAGVGLALLLQNTRARSVEFANLFIGRIPPEERGGPGDFPVETLFGKAEVRDVAAYRLEVVGEVDRPLSLTYADILALPAQETTIRLSCVSGWTERVVWRGPRVRDVLALAQERAVSRSVAFHSLSGYGVTWHRDRLEVDDALLATHANGAPLSENHGFPVRLIVPGYPGQNMVKQIDRLFVRADAEEFRPDFSLVAATGDERACAPLGRV
ncbi:MAG: molybdopterin-dependent oxidoreductase [Dehalococcoidia bacterium]